MLFGIGFTFGNVESFARDRKMIPVAKNNNRLRMHFRCTCIPVATMICVAACSQALQVRLFNNTRDPITLHVTTLHGFLEREKDIVVGSGLSAQFDYPGGTLRMMASGCEFTYSLPNTFQGYPIPRKTSYGVAVQAQLEPDLVLYLVPYDAKTVSDVKLSDSLQVQGFPLRPSSRTCPHGPDT
jgi:hypothetical protein